jgi:hypothetical protein
VERRPRGRRGGLRRPVEGAERPATTASRRSPPARRRTRSRSPSPRRTRTGGRCSARCTRRR